MRSSKTLLVTTAERKRSMRSIVAVVVPFITIIAIAIGLILGPFKNFFHNDDSSNTISSPIHETPKSRGNVCVNSETFRYLHDGKLRTCRNIRMREDRRQTLCLIEAVNEACPQTCGCCCQDLIDYTFTRFNSLPGTCNWLRQKPVRISKYCNYIDKSFNGRTVRDGCPVTCDFCFSKIEVSSSKPTTSPPPTKKASSEPSISPSATPTRPPSPQPSPFPTSAPSIKPSISPSRRPSQFPSDIPSLKPSQFPSDIPSLNPSQYPSSKPSQFPSNPPSLKPSQFPSDIPSLKPSQYPSLKPSQFPSEIPSLKPSQFPSDIPSLKPSQYPSLKPSQFPSEIPSLEPTISNAPTISSPPSLVPSVVPSLSPSTVPSVVPSESPTIECSDDDEFKFDGDLNHDCEWIRKNVYKRDRRIAAKCPFPEIRIRCMKTCDACDEECADDDALEFNLNNGNPDGNCDYIYKNVNKREIRRAAYCGQYGVSCPFACGLCPDSST